MQAFAGCNGALFYAGFGGASLDGDRLDGTMGNDRLRIKPYSMLPSEYQRVLALSAVSADFTQTELGAASAGMSEFSGASYWR